jgi:hypothetical protein
MLVKKEMLANPALILHSGLLLACVQLLQAEKEKLEIFLAPRVKLVKYCGMRITFVLFYRE